MNHNDVILKLETTIQSDKGQALASAQGLCTVMETMVYSSHFMLFEEAFHIYSLFFEIQKDKKPFRDVILPPEIGLMLPACRRLLFPLLHSSATKEIGDVCTQASLM